MQCSLQETTVICYSLDYLGLVYNVTGISVEEYGNARKKFIKSQAFQGIFFTHKFYDVFMHFRGFKKYAVKLWTFLY